MTAPPLALARGERKLAVALFADLSGYTALCRRLDPEDVETTVAPLMRSLRAAVMAEGGVIASVAGDGFFAMFGVPLALADGPVRAIRSARAMCALVAARNAEPGLQRVPDVHIGIAAGEVLVTDTDDALGWSVVGNAVNLASRLCDSARPGEVLVDDVCRSLVPGGASWQTQRSLEVKGHDHAIDAWIPDEEPSDQPAAGGLPSFVGRAPELQTLDEVLAGVVAERVSHVQHVTGFAGVGKSRLVAEWLDRHSGVTQLWVWGANTLTGQTLMRLTDLLSEAAGDLPDANPADEAGLRPANVAYQPDRFPALVAHVRDLIQRVAARRPVVLVIDDLPMDDPAIIDLIRDLDERPLAVPVLVLCTQRTGESGIATRSDLHVEPLARSDIDELVDALFGATAPAHLREAITRRADGYPLMAVQTAAYLVEAHIVEVNAGEVEVLAPHDLDTMPTSLRLFVQARLDQLSAVEKATAQELSTFGDGTDEAWATKVLGRLTRPTLDALTTRGILRLDADGRWRFAHGLVQEVAYATLTRRARTDLHARQLDLLPAHAPAEARAFHAVARMETVSAGDSRATAQAAVTAIREVLGYGRVLHATQAGSCHAALERVAGLVGDYVELCADDSIGLLSLDAQCLLELGRFDEAAVRADRAEALARGHSVRPELRVETMLVRGRSLSKLRRFESARQELDEASQLAEELADDSLRAQALMLSAQTWRITLPSRERALTETAFELFESAGDVEGAGECARLLAYLHSCGPVARFNQWYDAARARTGHDEVRGRASLARALAMATSAQMDYVSAEQSAREAVALGEQLGAFEVIVDGLIDLAAALVALGRIDEAVETAERLTALGARHADSVFQVRAAVYSVIPFLRGGQLERCTVALRAAREIAADLDATELERVSNGEAALREDRGYWREAFEAIATDGEDETESSHLLIALFYRVRVVLLSVQIGIQVAPPVFRALRADCLSAGAALLASYVDALADLSRVASGDLGPPSEPAPGVCLDELAVRADCAALRAEGLGEDATELWRTALDTWRPMGDTIWLARAQARSGDLAGARRTLAALDAAPEAQDWAISRPAG